MPNKRLTRAEQVNQPSYAADPQAPIEMGPKPQQSQYTTYDKDDGFELDPTAGNGGMRVDVTLANADGVFALVRPERHTDEHEGAVPRL